MARRGRKAKAQGLYSPQQAAQLARAFASAAAGKPFRKPRTKRSAPSMSEAEMVLRQQEAASLLGTRRSFIGRQYDRTAGLFRSQSGKKGRRRMARGRKGSVGAQQTYAQVTGAFPIQVSQSVAEALFALGSVGVDVYTTSTVSKADDLAFPVVQTVAATVGRWGAQKYLARKHPGLAATVSAGFSAANGDRFGTLIRSKLDSFLKPGPK